MTENLTKKIKKTKGFTLIELIIVVAIIAILAALAIPKLMGTQDNAKRKADVANAKMIHDTTVKLMTENKLTKDDWKFQVDSGAAATTNAKVLLDELQTNPVPKFNNNDGTKRFYVNINTTNNTVLVTFDTEGGVGIYPNISSDYSK